VNETGVNGVGSTRGEALRRRRLSNGIKSVRELQQRSGISREAITSAEAGTASAATYERLDAWFTRYEQAIGSADHSNAQVEFEVLSDEGVRVVVRGLISDAEELERSVARIIRNLRQAG
jgi:transcriptional regulator with XRE-family HTH domain